MLKLLDYLKSGKGDKDRDKKKVKEEKAPTFTEEEKKEIVTTLHLYSSNGTGKNAEEVFSTFNIGKDVAETDLEEAKNFFQTREPEAWEQNILSLERGEFTPEMPESA